MRVPKEWGELIMDRSLSDGAKVTAELLSLLGKKVGGMKQEEIAGLRGISGRQFRSHLRELDRKKTSAPISIYKRDSFVSGKRLGGADLVGELRGDRTRVKVLGWLERCAREGVDPFGCVGGECYGRIVGEDEEYGVFRCGGEECFMLLWEAAKRELLVEVPVSELLVG